MMRRRERTQNDAPKSDGILFENALEAVLQHRVPPHPELIQRAEPTIRTRGENRMIGMKQSPRTDLAAL
jgi:hypothetical protein